MDTPHCVCDFSFEVSFASEAAAFEQHNALGEFVPGRLVPVVDQVFESVSPRDGSVVRIDTLFLDLGRIPAASYYEETETRLRARLEEALREKLRGFGAETPDVSETEGLVSRSGSELDLVVAYLRTGRLPWNRGAGDIDATLRRVIDRAGPSLASRLKGARNTESIARRLARQFPEDLLRPLARLFNAASGPVAANAWESTLVQLMRDEPSVASLRTLLEDAVGTGDAASLQGVWTELVSAHPALIAEVVASLGVRANVRKSMASGFAESMLRDVARIFEPKETDFIEGVFGALGAAGRTELWEFAFTYLLIERGSRFERRAFVTSVARQMAVREDRPCEEILSRFEKEPAVVWAKLLAEALVSGNAEPLGAFWPEFARNHRNTVAEVVRRVGVRADVRHRMATGFSEPMLRDIAAILEPAEIAFIDEVTSRPELFSSVARNKSESARDTKKLVWEFTLTYLLAERGSRFNRRSYTGSVLRQMAAHGSLRYDVLLTALYRYLAATEVSGALRGELLSLLSELQADPSTAHEDEDKKVDDAQWTELLADALATGDVGRLRPFWPEMTRNHAATIARVVRLHGIRAEVRRQMTEGFPDPILRDIAAVLEPSEITFIDDLTSRQELFREAVGPRAEAPSGTRKLLWAFTFTYLLAERGSRFNRRSYTGGVVRQMAAHANVRYESLLANLSGMLQTTAAPGPLRADLLSLLSELRGSDENGTSLEAAAAGSHPEALLTHWDHSIRNERPALEAAFRRMGLSAAARRSLATAFPESILLDLAGLLLEPDDVAFIDFLTRRETTAAARKRLWEFTLAYLFVEGRGRFDRRSYVASVTRQLAVDRNVRYPALLVSLAVELGDLPAGNMERDLFRLLRELAAEAGADVPPGPASRIRAAELYDMAIARLGGHQGDIELASLLDELKRDYPWQLRRVGEFIKARRALPRDLSNDEVRTLLEIAGFGRRGAGALNEREYYRRVLGIQFRAFAPAPAVAADLTEEALTAAFLRAGSLNARELKALAQAMEVLFTRRPEWFPRLLRKAAWGAPAMRQLVAAMPEAQLTRILELTAPRGWQTLERAADAIAYAGNSAGAHLAKWRFLFRYFFRSTEASVRIDEAAFTRQFIDWLAGQDKRRNPLQLAALLRDRLLAAGDAPTEPLRQRLADVIANIPAGAAATPKPAASRLVNRTEEDFTGDIYIRNAGQVIATPYLPRLFQMLDLLENGLFRDDDCAERGAHLLQYMVNEADESPEHLLTLNKILCGIAPGEPIRRAVDLTSSEKEAVDGLIASMIAHWKAIGNTSLRGFRESFLQREGRLRMKKGAWNLLVQPRAFDMLLDRLPWGFNVVKHPWMQRAVYVEWR